MTRPRLAAFAALALAALSFTPSASAASVFSITEVQPIGGSFAFTDGRGISETGQVVGQSSTETVGHPYIAEDGVTHELPTPDGNTGWANAVNSRGQAAGLSVVNCNCGFGQIGHAFRWTDGARRDLGSLAGPNHFSEGLGINSAGQVVGQSETAVCCDVHAFLWSDGTMQDLGTLGGAHSIAWGTKHRDQAVGEAQLADGRTHAFFFVDGAMHDLGTLGGRNSSARAMTYFGVVVGQSQTAAGALHAFLWSKGTMHDLGSFGRQNSIATAVRKHIVVGFGYDVSPSGEQVHQVPFLRQQGHMTDLNTLLPAGSGWRLLTATGINLAGQITGDGLFHGEPRAYVLTP